jgi:hypothetical protein
MLKTLASLFSLFLNLFYIPFSLDLGFPHGIRALKLSRAIRSLHFCISKKKKNPIQKAPHHKSFFSRKLITNIGLSHKDRQNPYYLIRIQAARAPTHDL